MMIRRIKLSLAKGKRERYILPVAYGITKNGKRAIGHIKPLAFNEEEGYQNGNYFF